MVQTLHTIYLTLTTNLRSIYHNAHFTDGTSTVQRGEMVAMVSNEDLEIEPKSV